MRLPDDTIAAIATAPGQGAVAIVRLSGNGAFDIARHIAPALDITAVRTARLLSLQSANGVIDQALVTVFAGPDSFTGEDTVEFSTHGGALIPALVLRACLEAGARQALAGEFTRRAVWNGKLDLVQAEAVGDLVAATAPAQARQALRQLDGNLSARIAALREELLQTSALLAYAIDFPEEDDGPIDPKRILVALEDVGQRLKALLSTADDGERVRRGALVVLAGPPNAGKSSLFNALLGRDRAMVTEIPGTTRDAIEGDVSIDGWPVRLVDTAGLRDSDDRLEKMGIEVSRRYLAEADLVLFCQVVGESTDGDDLAGVPLLRVETKVDEGAEYVSRGGAETRRTSAVTGEGLPELRAEIVARLFGGVRQSRGDEVMLTSARQRIAVGAALRDCSLAHDELVANEPVLAAHQLRSAVLALEELIGVVDTEEVFDRVFSGFCVGK